MRLVSQVLLNKGHINIPYDMYAIALMESERMGVWVIKAENNIDIRTLGIYSNQDQAETVMEEILAAGARGAQIYTLPEDRYNDKKEETD